MLTIMENWCFNSIILGVKHGLCLCLHVTEELKGVLFREQGNADVSEKEPYLLKLHIGFTGTLTFRTMIWY